MPVHPLGSCYSQTGKCRLAPFLLPGLGSVGTPSVRIFPRDPIHITILPYPWPYYLCCFLDSKYEPANLLFHVFIHLFLVSPFSCKNKSSQSRNHFCRVQLGFQSLEQWMAHICWINPWIKESVVKTACGAIVGILKGLHVADQQS